jgi:hypothetical protein
MRAQAEIAERSLSFKPWNRTQFRIRRRASIVASFFEAPGIGFLMVAINPSGT